VSSAIAQDLITLHWSWYSTKKVLGACVLIFESSTKLLSKTNFTFSSLMTFWMSWMVLNSLPNLICVLDTTRYIWRSSKFPRLPFILMKSIMSSWSFPSACVMHAPLYKASGIMSSTPSSVILFRSYLMIFSFIVTLDNPILPMWIKSYTYFLSINPFSNSLNVPLAPLNSNTYTILLVSMVSVWILRKTKLWRIGPILKLLKIYEVSLVWLDIIEILFRIMEKLQPHSRPSLKIMLSVGMRALINLSKIWNMLCVHSSFGTSWIHKDFCFGVWRLWETHWGNSHARRQTIGLH